MSQFDPSYFLHAANILLLVAYSVRDILWLRLFAVASSLIAMPYFIRQPKPLWEAIAWSAVFAAINLFQSGRLVLERRPVKLTPEEEDVRRLSTHRTPRSARLVVALASVLLLAATDTTAESAQLRASTGNPEPTGLVVVIENKPRENKLNLQALNNPYISGVALQIHWSDLEPVEGHPDWSKLDQLFAAAESSKKWVQLLIFPGFFSPAWALQSVHTEMFPLQYGPGKGTIAKLPMPWDDVYLNRWFAFVKLLSDRYGISPAFRVIAAAGPTSVSAEYTLPSKPEDIPTWLNAGYTPERYAAAWEKNSASMPPIFRISSFPCRWVLASTSMNAGKSLLASERKLGRKSLTRP